MRINSNALLILIVGVGLLSAGPAFASYGDNAPGFFAGLWDGTVWIGHLVSKIYSDAVVYQDYNSGFGYNLGFFGTLLCLSWHVGIIFSIMILGWDALVFILFALRLLISGH